MKNNSRGSQTPARIFEAFASRYRRIVLCLLHGSDGGETSVERLTTEVAARTGERRGVMALSLRHAHLPKLDDLGFLGYDREGDTVRYDRSPAVGTLLDTGLADCPAQD